VKGGAGIGGGVGEGGGNASVGIIRIADAEVVATGADAPAVGSSAARAAAASVRFGGRVNITAGTAARASAIHADAIALENAAVTVQARAPPAFGEAPAASGNCDLSVLYEAVTVGIAEPLGRLQGPFIQIGNISLPAGKWTLSVALADATKVLPVEAPRVKSLLASVSRPGAYRLSVANANGGGQLVSEAGESTFVVNESAVFFPIARLANGKTPPVITRTSSPSWGVFQASGPTSDQVIRFTLVDLSGKHWTVFWRFDTEPWRADAAAVAPGENAYTFAKTSFTGTRLRAGAHTASIYVSDSDDAASNVISVSYRVAN
jgi:hypothetical protein